MLVLELAFDVVLIVFFLALLPLSLGDLLLFADPASSPGFLLSAGAFVAVLWIIDHVTDELFWPAPSGVWQIAASPWRQLDWRLPALFLKFRAG